MVLDAGCGAGYGAKELASAACFIGIDNAREAVDYAREHFGREGASFLRARCEEMPFQQGIFDLITAFEVIEHIDRWPELLSEARRVLSPGGILLVSTPNISYYAEMRAEAGPNPFHRHEFGFEEFQNALAMRFPYVRIWAQNHADAIVFAPGASIAEGRIEIEGEPDFGNSHFFLAACSGRPIENDAVYAWLPSTANVLREREQHIAKLENSISDLKTSRAGLHIAHERALQELKERASWGRQLEATIAERDARLRRAQEQMDEMEREAETRLAWVREIESQLDTAAARMCELEAELEARTHWAVSREAELTRELETRTEWANRRESELIQELRERTDWATVREAELSREVEIRTEWARSIERTLAERTEHVALQREEIENLRGTVREQSNGLRARDEELVELRLVRERQKMIARSRWVRLGRLMHVGPAVDSE
jgi:predicted SAM-dependent methyltransferase